MMISLSDDYKGIHQFKEPYQDWYWFEVWGSDNSYWWQAYDYAEGIHKEAVEGPFRSSRIAYNDAMGDKDG